MTTIVISILLKRKRAGQRVIESITAFLEARLKLKVNLQNSATDVSGERKFLDFNLYHYQERIRIHIAPKAIERCERKIRKITAKSNGQNISQRILQLNTYLRGRIQYFSLSNTLYVLTRIEGWMRRRLRMCLWKQWKKINTRYRKLIQLGLPDGKALSLA